MPAWQDVFQNRKDELITGINKDRRDIERLHDAINAINDNIHIQQVELDAVERALTAVPDGRLTAAEVTKRIAATNLNGMTDERVKG